MSSLKKTFFQKLRFKYKLSLLNESTLAEVWHIRLNRIGVILIVIFVLIVLFFLNTFLLLKTPLKKFTPGYLDSEIRTELIQETIKMDSLLSEIRKNEDYLNAVRNVIAGDIKIDSIMTIDSIVLLERYSTFLEASEAEKKFREDFENEEKYNLSVIETKQNQDLLVFSAPTRGIIIENFNLNKHNGIDISTSANESVVSVIDGTILFTGYTVNESYVIIVQHADNHISFYKNNSTLLKHIGDRVKAGEAIAIVGKNDKSEGGFLHFEIWKDGIPLNPENIIVF
jgi:murein DD-endopeptidase MepM/ murein hydrolase activator NlpD